MSLKSSLREDRFWSKVIKMDKHWLWIGATIKAKKARYGQFWNGSRLVMAHRHSYEITKGKIPNGLTIDHQCNVPLCVRPSHLKPMTLIENIMRSNSWCAKQARKTHCKNGHKLVGKNIDTPRNIEMGWRECLACKRKNSKEIMRRIRESKTGV